MSKGKRSYFEMIEREGILTVWNENKAKTGKNQYLKWKNGQEESKMQWEKGTVKFEN